MNVGFTCGAFDLLHPGHLSMLKECRENCDLMVVGLQTDPSKDRSDTKEKPVQSVYERWYQLKSCRYVDEVVPYDDERDLINLLMTVEINTRFVGSEYADLHFTGKDLCMERGIRIHYCAPRLHDYSSTNMRKRLR